MSPTPPPTAIEQFALILLDIVRAAVARTNGGIAYPWSLPPAMVAVIGNFLRPINQCLRRIADRVRDGKYAPRRSGPRRAPSVRKPRPPGPVPKKFGWLVALVPEARGHGGQIAHLLQNPEMVALLQAAPTTLIRPLRSLCWALQVTPPAILARPPRPRRATRPRPTPPPKVEKPPHPLLPRSHPAAPAPKSRASRPPLRKA